jgi:hypothetical protein
MGPPSTPASRERGRDLVVEKKCIVAVRRIKKCIATEASAILPQLRSRQKASREEVVLPYRQQLTDENKSKQEAKDHHHPS